MQVRKTKGLLSKVVLMAGAGAAFAVKRYTLFLRAVSAVIEGTFLREESAAFFKRAHV